MTHKLILISLLLFGLGLRVFHLDLRPLGFSWDEAALGYNAYSLLKTGRDEHGQAAPIVFKSFGDFKPGLYIYFAVPSVALLGLSEFSTRLPSALFGTLSIALVYILARLLLSRSAATYSALLLAINPWAIHFSRGAWESNVSLSLTLLGSVLFLRRKFLAAAVFFGLTFWTYQGAKLFTPLLFLALVLLNYRTLIIKSLFRPAVVLFLLGLPILLGSVTQSGRLKVFSVFSYTRPPSVISEILRQDGTASKDQPFYVFHSESLDQLRGVLQRYLNHFSPRFIFTEGDWSNPRQATPFYGYLHLPEILTLILGLFVILNRQVDKSRFLNHKSLILAWLLLAPIPSALSRDIISAVRSLPLMIPLVLISGFGLSRLASRKLLLAPFLILLAVFTAYYLDLYFIHSPFYTASGWLYPYRPAMALVANHLSDYSKVVISDKLGQPYIFTLFYLKINPRDYQGKSAIVDSPVGDVGRVSSFGKFKFRPIFWPADRGLTGTLFVGDAYELPESDLQSTPNLIRLGDLTPPDGYPAWRVVALP